jgi:hypothetical protein
MGFSCSEPAVLSVRAAARGSAVEVETLSEEHAAIVGSSKPVTTQQWSIFIK